MTALRKLGTHFLHFFSGTFASLLIGLISFPILTRILSTEDYGTMALITVFSSIAVAVAKGGLSDSIIRFYREYEAAHNLPVFTSTVVFRGLVLVALVTALYVALSADLHDILGIPHAATSAFLIMAGFLFVRPLSVIVLNFLRATGRTVFYNLMMVGLKLTSVVFAVALLLIFNRQLSAYFSGIVIAEVLIAIVLWRWFFKTYSVSPKHVSGSLAWTLMGFGLPLLATELGYLLLIYSDRYILAMFHGPATLGVYSVGYSLPQYINDLVLFSVSYSIVPIYTELYAKKGREETQEFLGSALKYYVMGILPLIAGYAAVCRDALVFLASDKYAGAAEFSPIIVCGLAFLGMNYILYAGLYLEKRSKLILLNMAIAVVVNIAMSLVLVPGHGSWGASMAMLIACATSSVMTAILSFRHLPIKLPYLALLKYGLASAAMFWLLGLIETGSPLGNLALKVPAGGVFMAAVMFLFDRPLMKDAIQLVKKRGH
ncbi:MAG TPA: oligosaccharide flippase family protein [Steroidobacteraceae bacterium]|nr:oligosaccharide flippase family protein [Steroidobacteraceae bacterium]